MSLFTEDTCLEVIANSPLHSWMRDAGSTTSRKEEAWACQGKEDAGLGEEIAWLCRFMLQI